MIFFKPRKNQITKHHSFRISGQKINTCSNVENLRITLDKNLEQNLYLNSLKLKLNRAIGHYAPKFQLKTLYYTIFHSYLISTHKI